MTWTAATLAQTTQPLSDWRTLTPPVVDGPWLRPAAVGDALPVWGLAEGMRVGLAPLPGPRGLLRIYTPYLGQPAAVMLNFLAIEPIVAGQTSRGFSEMERGRLDGQQGKRFTAGDAPPPAAAGQARGTIETVDGQPALRLYVDVEPFENGAHVYVRLTFRADRPHAVGVATFACADSKPLDSCIVTATMGNYARLRELHLADRTVTAGVLWPDYRDTGFADHVRFGLNELSRTADGAAVVTATPNEASPKDAVFGPRGGWPYAGVAAVQSWTCAKPDPKLEVLVNARATYWGLLSPIPGGVAFENFEMVQPFHDGEEYWFAAEPIVKAGPATR